MNIPGKCDIVPWVYMSSAYGLVIVWERCIVNDKLSTPYDELHWQGRLLIQFSWQALCTLRPFFTHNSINNKYGVYTTCCALNIQNKVVYRDTVKSIIDLPKGRSRI